MSGIVFIGRLHADFVPGIVFTERIGAAVANPKVLILDEATSSIDSHTEALISRGMDQLMEGRTSFVIAHRLSTIRNSDVIMVMDHGEIIERGDHESLMEKRGIYYKLYTGQIELD